MTKKINYLFNVITKQAVINLIINFSLDFSLNLDIIILQKEDNEWHLLLIQSLEF